MGIRPKSKGDKDMVTGVRNNVNECKRGYAFAREMDEGKPVFEVVETEYVGEDIVFEEEFEKIAYKNARLPEYQTKHSAGADFFAAEDVVIPSLWKGIFSALGEVIKGNGFGNVSDTFKPTLVHTGVKAFMQDDEVLELYNRSSNPKKLGLVLANSVGVVDADYYENPDNDGEIMFAFYNFKLKDVKIKAGDRIGQGVFKKFLKADNAVYKDEERKGGFGSTSR